MSYQANQNAGVSVSATTTSAPGTLPAAGVRSSALYIVNAGTVPIFIRYGAGAQTATLTDFPVPAGQGVFVAKGQSMDGVAAITQSGTATVYFCGCDGNTY